MNRSAITPRQWPKMNHKIMITGIGTPISQSRSPFPIVSSIKHPTTAMQKWMSRSGSTAPILDEVLKGAPRRAVKLKAD